MSVIGHLSEFSLAELFQFLEQGNKTGLLTISHPTNINHPKETHFGAQPNHLIWFRQGRIVAAANRPDHKGLLNLIEKRGWLGEKAVYRLASLCRADSPVGLCFKSQGLLDAEQLKRLFYVQVMQQVCELFTLKDAQFNFNAAAPIPNEEMTGLSAPATEVTLAGLRALKDWTALADKLPAPESAVISVIEGNPTLRLKQVEWQLWEFTDGTAPLTTIAKQMQLSVEKVQRIAFRLTMVGLVEEMPLLMPVPDLTEMDLSEHSDYSNSGRAKHSNSQNTEPTKAATGLPVSQSFLQNLVQFLKL